MFSLEEEMFEGRNRYAAHSLKITDVVNHTTATVQPDDFVIVWFSSHYNFPHD
jgi:hypothetical protein